ncbi:hypothetical protein J6590_065272 [Homalodisca vitripennis]|nr:hypothetical protein J6590_065272 [Homalodisca vitripennis]
MCSACSSGRWRSSNDMGLHFNRLAKNKPKNKAELKFMLAQIWRSIKKEDCLTLIDSMPKRIKECYKANGGPIDY